MFECRRDGPVVRGEHRMENQRSNGENTGYQPVHTHPPARDVRQPLPW